MSSPPPRSTLFPYTTLFRSILLRIRPAPGSDRADSAQDGSPSSRSTSPWRTRRSSSCRAPPRRRSEEHTSELQSRVDLVCRLLLEKKNQREASDDRAGRGDG